MKGGALQELSPSLLEQRQQKARQTTPAGLGQTITFEGLHRLSVVVLPEQRWPY